MFQDSRSVTLIASKAKGRRTRAHWLAMDHSLGRGRGRGSGKLNPLVERIITILTTGDRPGPHGPARPVAAAKAFVAAHAVVAVVRAMIAQTPKNIPHDDIEDEIAQTIVGLLSWSAPERT